MKSKKNDGNRNKVKKDLEQSPSKQRVRDAKEEATLESPTEKRNEEVIEKNCKSEDEKDSVNGVEEEKKAKKKVGDEDKEEKANEDKSKENSSEDVNDKTTGASCLTTPCEPSTSSPKTSPGFTADTVPPLRKTGSYGRFCIYIVITLSS